MKTQKQKVGLLLVCLIGILVVSACGALGPAATPTATSAPPRDDIQVAVDGSGDYPTLEQAIAAAEQRATITLGPGTYRLVRHLEIDKALTLIGAGMDETEIVSGAGDYVVRFIGTGSFAAEDITFRHDGPSKGDVVVVRNGNADFLRCRFVGAKYVEGEGNQAGLRFQQSSRGSVRESVAEGNDNTGILLESSADVTLERNACSDNTVVGIGYMDRAEGVARENECLRNSIGIAVAVEARPTLERNICNDNEYGIAYIENGGGTSSQNECSRNKIGITVGGSANPQLVDNNCQDNTEEDIRDLRE